MEGRNCGSKEHWKKLCNEGTEEGRKELSKEGIVEGRRKKGIAEGNNCGRKKLWKIGTLEENNSGKWNCGRKKLWNEGTEEGRNYRRMELWKEGTVEGRKCRKEETVGRLNSLTGNGIKRKGEVQSCSKQTSMSTTKEEDEDKYFSWLNLIKMQFKFM